MDLEIKQEQISLEPVKKSNSPSAETTHRLQRSPNTPASASLLILPFPIRILSLLGISIGTYTYPVESLIQTP